MTRVRTIKDLREYIAKYHEDYEIIFLAPDTKQTLDIDFKVNAVADQVLMIHLKKFEA